MPRSNQLEATYTHLINPVCLLEYFKWQGHINHSLFWKNFSPKSGLGGKLENGVSRRLNVTLKTDFKTKFNTTTASIQGSGWGWLVLVEESQTENGV
ncbi:hypothetical protein JOM56_012080 [Amanita muscaria]